MSTKRAFLQFIQKPDVLASLFYWLSHLLCLTLLPVFNDEAIYIDWGWREIHSSNLLFFSLFDGKQPLLMWLFGFMQIIVPSPLIAARLIAVSTGFCTILGLRALTNRYFPQLKSWQVILVYSLLPIFVFFDRQALMESAVAAVGVWSCYLTLGFLEKSSLKTATLLGSLLGIGIFIKSTPVIFCFEAGLLLVLSFKNASWEVIQKKSIYFLIALSTTLLVLFPLLVQPLFSNIISMNSRFSLGLGELVSFPMSLWLHNLITVVELSVVYITPLVLICTLYSFKLFSLRKDVHQKRILIWLLAGLSIFILTVKNPSPRYIVAFLPLISIFAVDGFQSLMTKLPQFRRAGFGLLVSIPVVISGLLIFTPLNYFRLLSSVTRFSQQTEYVSEWTSGYGVQEACDYLTEASGNKRTFIFIRLDSGNPENSIMSCFQKSDLVKVQYLPQQISLTDLKQALCQSPNIHPYFVSRDLQMLGMESLLTEKKKFMKPVGDKFVGVYQFKSCAEL